MEFIVNNLTKIYNNSYAVKDFSYHFEPGLYLLTGQNGVGKSTILKMMSNIIKVSNNDYSMSKLKKVFICEKIELSNGTVYEYLNLIRKINNVKADIKAIIKKWQIPNKDLNILSKGNRQKVAIIMSYLAEADLYLFDEPTDSLDKDGIILFKEYLHDLIDKNKIIIVASHEKKYFQKIPYKEIKL